MAKVLAFQIKIDGTDTVVKTTKQLRDAIRQTNDALAETEIGSQEYKRLTKQLGQLKEIQRSIRQDTRDAGKEFVNAADAGANSYNALNARLQILKRTYKELSQESRNAIDGQQLAAEIQRISNELKALDSQLGDNFRNVGNYEESIQRALSGAEGLLGGNLAALAAGVGLGSALSQGLELIDEGIQAVAELTARFIELRGEVQRFTGATGDDLDAFTVGVSAISDTFGKSTDEVLRAANTLTKQLTGDFSESLRLIEGGFLSGADAGGQLLDNIAEYAPFFREAGFTGEEFVSLISRSVQEGVFSDKGIDAIKEANLRLRELPASTRSALEAIGFTSEEIQSLIEEQGIGAAISAVSERLQGFRDDAPEVGRALADIFGGPGEDAGIQFVKSLADVDAGLSEVIDTSNELTRQQQRQLELNKQLSAAQNELSRELASTTQTAQELGQRALVVILEGLLRLIQAVKAIPEFLRENRTEIAALGAAFIAFNAQSVAASANALRLAAAQKAQTIATSAVAGAQRLLNVAMRSNPIGLVITAVGLLVAGFQQAYKRSEEFRASIAGLGRVANEIFTIVKEAVGSFVDGFNAIREGRLKEGFARIGEAVTKSNPIGIAFTQGKRLKNAFIDGYNDRKASEAIARDKEGAERELQKFQEGTSDKAQKAGQKISAALAAGVNGTPEQVSTALDATEKIVEGSVAYLQQEISKLRSSLENQVQTNEIRKTLEAIAAKEEELERVRAKIEAIRREVEQPPGAPAGAAVTPSFAIDPETTEESARQLEELEARRAEAAQAEIERLEIQRLKQIEVLRAQYDDEEEFARQRQILNAEIDRQILNERLALAQIGSREYLEIQQQIADKEVELNKLKGAQLIDQEAEVRRAIARQIIEQTQFAANTVFSIQQQTAERERDEQIEALREQYEQRIELAQGDREEQERLREELAERTEAIELAAAREEQKRAVKQAIINAALAVGTALLTQPFIPAGLIAAAQAAAIGAAQVITIRSQSFERGGFTGSAPMGTKQDASGHKPVGVVHENEYVVPAKVLRTKEGALHVAALEGMRKKSGYGSAGKYALYQEGGATSNVIIPPATVSRASVSVNLTDKDVERIAEAVRQGSANGTREGAKDGAFEGSSKAIRDSDRLAERKAFLEQKSSV